MRKVNIWGTLIVISHALFGSMQEFVSSMYILIALRKAFGHNYVRALVCMYVCILSYTTNDTLFNTILAQI